LLTLTSLAGFLQILVEGQDHQPHPPPPLDLGVVEIAAPRNEATSAPAADLSPPPADAAPQPEPEPEPPPAPAKDETVEMPVTPPPPPPPEPTVETKPPPKPNPKPAPASPPRRVAPKSENPKPVEPTTPAPPSSTSSHPLQAAPSAPNRASPGIGNMGARAIYQPLPQIPPALRRRAVELVAVARFHVAASGAADVELIEPTSDPELNRALLASLKTWRFFPAMDQGRPVASSIEIRIPISVQ
jgi:protein TonB